MRTPACLVSTLWVSPCAEWTPVSSVLSLHKGHLAVGWVPPHGGLGVTFWWAGNVQYGTEFRCYNGTCS